MMEWTNWKHWQLFQNIEQQYSELTQLMNETAENEELSDIFNDISEARFNPSLAFDKLDELWHVENHNG